MARAINRLSARGVATAKPGMHADGGGLYLQVTPTGARSWIFRYTRAGKAHDMGLGPVHTVSLAEARLAALGARQALLAGADPLAQRRAAVAATAGVPTFKEARVAYVDQHRAGWKNPKHADQWANTLEAYADPVIGALPVDQVTTEHLVEILKPIWATKTETATRVRQRIEVVLDAAKVQGKRSGENPARWRGHLDKLLPKPSKVKKARHFSAMPYAALPAFMATLRAGTAIADLALEWTILTAARTGMTRFATWDEIDRKHKTWTVPGERMKAGVGHVVPLPLRCLEILDALPREKGNPYLFPGSRKPHMSNNTMDKRLEDLGQGAYTVHGFRSTFKDWASETTSFPNEVSEAALAHTIENKTEAAYRRGALLAKRRELMEAWAEYVRQTPG